MVVSKHHTWIATRCMQVRIGVGVMKGGPVMLIGTVCVPRPLKQILRSLIVENKFNKFSTKDGIRTATDNIYVVRWPGVCDIHIFNFTEISSFFPHLHYSHIRLRTLTHNYRLKCEQTNKKLMSDEKISNAMLKNLLFLTVAWSHKEVKSK